MINNNENKNNYNGNTAKNLKNNAKTTNNRSKQGSMDEISPWLVQDNVISKKQDKSKIPMLKTVITTELWKTLYRLLAFNKKNTNNSFKWQW